MYYFKDELTPTEECVLKNAVNCGRPKDRLTLFLLGMDSIKKKVHQVIYLNMYLAKLFMYLYCVRIYSYSIKCLILNTAHQEEKFC